MRSCKLKIAFVALSVATPTALNAQAFGVQMGSPVSQYGGHKSPGSDRNYRIRVPQPNNEFDFYTAWATPETGICKVIGYGKDHANDPYGTGTKTAFNRLKAALKARYGNNKEFDFLKRGAVWTKPNEWIWSVYKEERYLSSYWDREEGSQLPENVSSIALRVAAINSTAAYVTLNYEFDNLPQCVAIFDRQNASGL